MSNSSVRLTCIHSSHEQSGRYSSNQTLPRYTNAFEEDRKDCLDAGMSEHVSKPIEIQSLLQTIESVLKK